jgi:competence protein ComEA
VWPERVVLPPPPFRQYLHLLSDESSAEPTALQLPEPVQLVPQPSASGGLIDLNIASAIELESLPGIGEKRARDIIEWRSLHALFTTVDDLLDIPGIGPVTVEKIWPFVSAE